jgi:hypothetical protein
VSLRVDMLLKDASTDACMQRICRNTFVGLTRRSDASTRVAVSAPGRTRKGYSEYSRSGSRNPVHGVLGIGSHRPKEDASQSTRFGRKREAVTRTNARTHKQPHMHMCRRAGRRPPRTCLSAWMIVTWALSEAARARRYLRHQRDRHRPRS